MTLYTDWSPFCCDVLRARVADGSLPPGDVVCADVRALLGGRLRQMVRRYTHVHLFCGIGGSPLGLAWAGWPADWPIVTGGFPCQDVSSAGKGAGLDGERSGLYREMLRAIRLIRPHGVLAENVGALSARGLDRLAREMGAVGYRPHALRVGAWAVGSPQERERWWIVANAAGHGRVAWAGKPGDQEGARRGRNQPASGGERCELADALCVGSADAAAGVRQARTAAAWASRSGQPLGHAEHARLEGHRPDAGQSQEPQPRHAGDPGRWPHPLWVNDCGEPVPTPQYDWEPPRLFNGSSMMNARWRLALMGYPLHWLDLPPDVAARHGSPSRVNKHGVEATGNAQVPQCVRLVAESWIDAMRQQEATA